MLKKYLGFQRGFTLIEMVIVIVVIGILMGLAFQGFSTIQQNARDTRRLADLRRVQVQLELFFSACGHYPVTGSTDTVCGTPPTGGDHAELSWSALRTALGRGGVASRDVPADPILIRNYLYRVGELGAGYVLGATMERMGNNPGLNTATFGMPCNTATLYCLRN